MTCDTPVSHSIDIPTEELKVLRSLERKIPHTIPTPTCQHIDKATNIIYTHMNRHTDKSTEKTNKTYLNVCYWFQINHIRTYANNNRGH